MTQERLRKLRQVLQRRQWDLTVLMDGVHKPHNLAAIARTCDAVGVAEVHAVSPDPDWELPSHQASGADPYVRVCHHTDLAAAYAQLRAKGFRLLAAHLASDGIDYREADYTVPTAIVVGAELDGLSEEAARAADGRLRIPMEGVVQSLNVSVATALILFEARRQRERAGMYERPGLEGRAFEKMLFEWMHPKVAEVYRARGEAYPPLEQDGSVGKRDA